jgi:hypothetical protein
VNFCHIPKYGILGCDNQLGSHRREYFHALRCYALDNHVFTDKINDTLYWYQYNGIVLTWMLGTLSVELQEIVHEPSEIAYRAWLAIEAQFLDNHESRALQLDEHFCAFNYGALSISYYYRKMKGMMNKLRSLGKGLPTSSSNFFVG